GAGGPLTLTDVNLLLGRIAPEKFGIPLNKSYAQKALDEIALQSDRQIPEAGLLEGFLAIANEKMAETIRRISVRKGYDPHSYALMAFGGAGGQHACDIAGLLHIKKII